MKTYFIDGVEVSETTHSDIMADRLYPETKIEGKKYYEHKDSKGHREFKTLRGIQSSLRRSFKTEGKPSHVVIDNLEYCTASYTYESI